MNLFYKIKVLRSNINIQGRYIRKSRNLSQQRLGNKWKTIKDSFRDGGYIGGRKIENRYFIEI